jgi:hypothetical protein
MCEGKDSLALAEAMMATGYVFYRGLMWTQLLT